MIAMWLPTAALTESGSDSFKDMSQTLLCLRWCKVAGVVGLEPLAKMFKLEFNLNGVSLMPSV